MPGLNEQKIAYLISCYPAVSHTFILNEVIALKNHGCKILTASINPSDRKEAFLTDQESIEAKNTFYIKQQGFFGAFSSLIKTFLTSPIKAIKALFFSFKLAGFDLKRLCTHFFYFLEALIVGHWMKKNDLNHLHVHFANPAAVVAILVKKTFSFSYSITVHGPDEFFDEKLQSLKEKIEEAKFVVCISFFAKSQLMRITDARSWNKLFINRMGIDLTVFKNGVEKAVNNTPTMLFVGRLSAAKGPFTLLKAMNHLKAKKIQVRLKIAGTGPLLSELKNETAKLQLETVEFLGPLKPEDVIENLKKADIFVLPSSAEGIPVALMEAMAMNVTPISSFIAGIPELITNEKNGLLCFASDDKGLADCIEKLINDEHLRISLGLKARDVIEEKYNLQKNIKTLSEIFKKQLGAS